MSYRSAAYLGMRRFTTPDGTFYVHPGGFRIKREHRGYDGRSYRGGLASTLPAWTFNVYKRGRGHGYPLECFETLRAAKAWCDEQ